MTLSLKSILLVVAVASPPAAPAPPYPLFAAPTPKFEPSAAAYDPASGLVLVLNDKDALIHAYRWQSDRLEPVAPTPPTLDAGPAIRKFEAIAPIPSAPGEYLAITAFDRDDPAFRRIVRFRYCDGPSIRATPVEIVPAALEDAVKKATGQRWFKFEGAAFDKAGTHVFLGLRNVGSDFKTFRDVVILLRCPFHGDRIGPPNAAFHFSTKEALAEEQGLSDFVRDPATGDYWLLTSRERGWKHLDDHGGSLFHVPAAWLAANPPPAPRPLDAPVATFKAKSEAFVPLPDRRKLVIFDADDDGWKKHFAGFSSDKSMYLFLP